MNTVQRFGLAVGLVVLACVVSVVTAPALPDPLVTHWNASGEPDGTMTKTIGVALIPGLSAVLLVLFAVIPKIDPRKENIAAFRLYYDWFVVLFTAFMAVLQGGVIAFNLGYEFDFTLFILGAVAVLFYYLGFLLTRAERNWFIGIRTPWTLESDEVWERTHQLGGRMFKLTALVSLFGMLFGDYAIYFLIVPALLTAIVTVVYSYYLYEQIENQSNTATEVNR